MADTNITIPELGSLTAGQVSDLLLVTRGTTGYKMLVSDIAKTIIETYAGSSLAGSAQSVKAALDSLNSSAFSVTKKVSDSFGNFANVVRDPGFYIFAMSHPDDASAYYIAFVYKSNSENPVRHMIANNKLSVGPVNPIGTIVGLYNGTATMNLNGISYRLQ